MEVKCFCIAEFSVIGKGKIPLTSGRLRLLSSVGVVGGRVVASSGVNAVCPGEKPIVGRGEYGDLPVKVVQGLLGQPPKTSLAPSLLDMHTVESKVRTSVREFTERLTSGKVPFASCLLARPYRGQTGYRPGACAPALQVAR